MAALLRGLSLISGVAEFAELTIFFLAAAAAAAAAGDGTPGGLGASQATPPREEAALISATAASSALDAMTSSAPLTLFSCEFTPRSGDPFNVLGVTAAIPPGRVGVV